MQLKSIFTTPAVAAIGLWLIGGTSPALADIINIPRDQPTIQAGIDAAVNGDEVVVADGIYTGVGNRDIDFGGKLITVRSTNGPDNCIVNCEGTEFDNHRGFYFDSGETADAVVDGFTITNGFVTASAPGGPNGGGLFLLNSSPTVTNCVVSGNTALDEFARGGGMYIELGSPVISDCSFAANTAEYRGGGIFCFDGNMTVTSSTFEGNVTPVIFQAGGGAIFSRDSQLNLVDCDLHDNEGFHGGAVGFVQFFGEGAGLTLINCSIRHNLADVGGGVFIQEATSLFVNSTLIANQVSGEFGVGGGIHLLSNSSGVLTNTTISANSAIEGGGMSVSANSSATVRNGILWDNIPNHISGSAVVRYSDVQGGWFGAGSNNIDADPLFVDPDNGDYRLSSGSPCIDAAANIYVPKGIDTDLDGNPRFVDDPDTKDTGFGDPPIVDMGAYEVQVMNCSWDLDSSGAVGASDLLQLLANWGNPYDAGDLLGLLANWGACP